MLSPDWKRWLEMPRRLSAFRLEASISTMVDLHDEAGTHVMSATVEWFIQRTPTP